MGNHYSYKGWTASADFMFDLLEKTMIEPQDKTLYDAICFLSKLTESEKRGGAFPKIDKLADMCNMSPARVRRSLARLCKVGLLRIEYNAGGGKDKGRVFDRTNLYIVYNPYLETTSGKKMFTEPFGYPAKNVRDTLPKT